MFKNKHTISQGVEEKTRKTKVIRQIDPKM